MYKDNRTLRDEVFTLFERACQERDYLLAEYLLQALEVMVLRDGDAQQVEHAYLVFNCVNSQLYF